jgi:hypothetical protein
VASGYQVLTEEQAEHFLTKGFVVIPECFSVDAAAELTETVWTRLGYDRDDQATWAEPSIHMPTHRHLDVKEFAPKAWLAACDLLGGEERIQGQFAWGDGFIVNLWQGADQPWEPASPTSPGWHKDGDFFRHYLDSPEQGLLTLVLWSHIEPRGGGTFVATDSVDPVARLLAGRPDGILPDEFDYDALIAQCDHFVETTGRLGDVVLLHPYVLHAVSQNHRGTARFITNPPITLREPMRFDRSDPADHSLVEQAVLRALGVDRLDFRPTGARERVVPERVLQQQQMAEEEQARLAEAARR